MTEPMVAQRPLSCYPTLERCSGVCFTFRDELTVLSQEQALAP